MRANDLGVSYLMRAAVLLPVVLGIASMFHAHGTGVAPASHAPAISTVGAVTLLCGFGVGVYGTLVGIGGGPLIVPVLVFLFGWQARYVVATSLMIVFFNALSGSAGYAWQRRIDYEGGFKFSLAALPGALASGLVHYYWRIHVFDHIFGLFLLGLAAYCALGASTLDERAQVRPERTPGATRVLAFRDRFGTEFRFDVNDKMGIRLNLALGFLVGFLGIGGGVLQVPILVYVLRYPIHIATATSHFITMVTCLFALAPNVGLGNVRFGHALWMACGVVMGAQVGAWLSPKLRAAGIMYLFVAVILVFALRLLVR